MARGKAAASTAGWWPAGNPGERSGEGIEDRSDEATPVDEHGAGEPDPDADEHPAADPGASPPSFAGDAADPGTDSGMATHAVGAGGAQGRPSVVGGSVATGVQAADAAENTRGELGQVGEIVAFLSRHGSPGPVVPSHCAGDSTASGGARPGSSSDCGGNAGLAPLTPGDGPGAHADGGAESGDALSLPLGASCVGRVAAAGAQHDLKRDRTVAGDDRSGGAGAANHDSAACVKVEVRAHLAPPDSGTPTAADEGGEALPRPQRRGRRRRTPCHERLPAPRGGHGGR